MILTQPSITIATASDENYFVFLQGLLGSIARHPTSVIREVVIFDCGLAATSVQLLAGLGYRIMPAPAFPVAIPQAPAYYRAMTLRPYLAELLPNADVVMWMDADTWLQGDGVPESYLAAASTSDLAACVETDRNYSHFHRSSLQSAFAYQQHSGLLPYHLRWRAFYDRHFQPEHAARLAAYPLINAGVFCARSDSPLWSAWQRQMVDLIERLGERFLREDDSEFYDKLVDQTSLNAVMRSEGFVLNAMPPTYNWMSHRSLPAYDGQYLREPNWPYAPLKVVHLTTDDSKFGEMSVSRPGDLIRASTQSISLRSPHDLISRS